MSNSDDPSDDPFTRGAEQFRQAQEMARQQDATARKMAYYQSLDAEGKRNYWWTVQVNDNRGVVVNGHKYHIGNATKHSFSNGCGGQRFVIEFFDGRIVETMDLWCNGEVPEDFRDRLPDNARFLPTEG